jgi:hypothetical protein
MHRALACSLFALTGCIDRSLSEVEPIQDNVETFDVPINVERDVDILFVIDSSPSMTEEHASLRANFGVLLDRLDDTSLGLPNVHIGVVSSDMGTAPYNVNSQCRADGGDRGLLHGATCAALGGASFIEDVLDADGTRRKNYTGTLDAVFGCTADVGVNGCGFERHLDAMRTALSPGTNPSFVRDDAALAVVFLADEDDCSASDARLYDPNSTNLGPITDFRCHTQGITCEDDPDPTTPGTRTGCVPNPSSAYLEPIDTYVDFLVDLKGNRNDVIVAGIVGDPDTVEIGVDAQGRPAVLATCPSGGLGASEPGIRFADFLSRFANSSLSTLCTSDLRAALEEVAENVREATGYMCLGSAIADRNPMREGIQADCSVTEALDGGTDRVIPACDSGAATPCWRIVQDGECDAGFGRLIVDRGGEPTPGDGRIRAQCTVE